MKIFAIVVLLIAVGLLSFDEWSQRAKYTESQRELADSQAEVKKDMAQISTLTNQLNQSKGQIANLDEQKAMLAKQVAVATATPAPTPVPAPVQAAPVEITSTQLVEKYSNALAIIEGKNGVGSGFVCNMDGHTCVITNAHVLADNPGFKITSVKGTVYTAGSSAVAVGRDLVKIEVTGAENSFDMASANDAGVKIGDTVTVLGNTGGAGVVTPVEGKVVGLGPDLVEVDAPFIPGNSGSPIIHRLSGKVIGVATYTEERKMDEAGGAVHTEIRRFGYKIDGVKQWETINWQAFYTQSSQLTAIETLSDDFVKMFGNGGNDINFDPANYTSASLQRSLRTFNQAAQQGGRTMSISDKKQLVEQLVSDLRSVSRADILSFNRNTAYDYFRREVDDQSQFRDDIYKGLSSALENLR